MKTKHLLICHAAILFLLGTFFWAPTRAVWDTIDVAIFKFLNSTLEGRPSWQLFWAFANHKLADWVEDLIFILFFIIAIRRAPDRTQRASQFLFLILFAGCTIFFVNRLLLRQNIDFPRPSPTLVIAPCVHLSDEIPWLRIKDDASSSFPGDHATTLLLFAAGYTFFAGWRLGSYAWFYALFRALPRLIAGAHWFTDIAVGSSAIALFFLGWAFYTPLHLWASSAIASFFRLWTKKSLSAKY